MDLLDFLIQDVSAQSDATSQPTFGRIDVGGSDGGTSSSVLISSDKTSMKVGETATLRVEIKTSDVSINEYRVVVEFDPQKFTALDQDESIPGTQIKLLDTIFAVEEDTDNSVSSGKMVLVAKTQSGNSFTVNRDVLEIKLQAQSTGSSIIKIVEGSSGTQLVRQTGFGLTFSTNEVTIQTEAAIIDNGNGNNGNGSGSTPPQNPVPLPGTIPNTALLPGLQQLTGLILGILLILFGILISFRRDKTRDK